ncbi:Protein disulfide-isomerase, partial [Neolecta irregularis DAH-3]
NQLTWPWRLRRLSLFNCSSPTSCPSYQPLFCLFAMKVFFKSLVIAIAAVSVSADVLESSDVLQMTKATFDDFVKDHELLLAEFYAPWCGHCKMLAHEYEQAATKLKEQNIPLIKVDCTEEEDLCSEQEVQGYPTLKVFRDAKSAPYQGARKYEAIVSYMTKQRLPAVSTLTKESHDEFTTSDKVVVICYLDKSDSTNAETFEKVANALRDDFLFGIVTDANVVASEKRPSIVLYRSFDEPKTVYNGKLTVEQLQKFIKTASVPLIGDIGPETYSTYIEAGVPLTFIFTEEADKERLVEELKPLAKKFKDHLNVATIDATAFSAHAGNLNLEAKWPAIAIHDTINNLKYPLDQTKEITFAVVEAFFESFIAGTLEPKIKSEEIPKTQDGPVTVVVAKNYDNIVLDDSKDVLIEFFAPWCGHCKKLAPEYEKLAQFYESYSDKVVIAKCDATLNDIPDKIVGFPTIKLYPANQKKEPVEYTGDRSLAGLAAFIAEQGTYKIDIEDKIKESEDATAAPETDGPGAGQKVFEKIKEAGEAVGGDEIHDEL